jgi:hypothetical protein
MASSAFRLKLPSEAARQPASKQSGESRSPLREGHKSNAEDLRDGDISPAPRARPIATVKTYWPLLIPEGRAAAPGASGPLAPGGLVPDEVPLYGSVLIEPVVVPVTVPVDEP